MAVLSSRAFPELRPTIGTRRRQIPNPVAKWAEFVDSADYSGRRDYHNSLVIGTGFMVLIGKAD